MRVEKVKTGKYTEPEFTFAIHSPARAGLKVGHRYTVEACEPQKLRTDPRTKKRQDIVGARVANHRQLP
jgi:hypothetical protein